MSLRPIAVSAAAITLLLSGCVNDTDNDGTAEAVEAPQNVELGTLTCQLAAVDNLLIYSQESFACLFEGNGRRSAYAGRIDKVGANLQLKNQQTLRWLVLAPARYDTEGAIAGNYVGASGEAAVGVGAGARLLVGGSENQITLQPLSVSTSTEAAGVSLTLDALELTYQGPA